MREYAYFPFWQQIVRRDNNITHYTFLTIVLRPYRKKVYEILVKKDVAIHPNNPNPTLELEKTKKILLETALKNLTSYIPSREFLDINPEFKL